MPHVTTRVKAKVDAVEGAELLCTAHEGWLPANSFSVSKEGCREGASARYRTSCKSCTNHERSLVSREGITYAEARQKVKQATSEGAFGASLNQARHTKGEMTAASKPLSTKLREELRERREESEGKPSMCYLVGMEGDNSAVKIGHSTNVFRRMAQYQAGNPRKLRVLALLPGGQAKEQELHRKFMRYHRAEFVGEWFAKAPEIMNHFAVGKVATP